MKRKKLIVIIVLIFITITFIGGILSNNLFSKEEQVKTADMLSIYLQDTDGEYYKQENYDFPKEGYSLDKSQSYCENESSIDFINNKIKIVGNKSDKCYLYFSNNNFVKDLSGNNYNGVIQNGGIIKLDGERRQGLYFDGEDDYVDVADLPETINWENGFTIEFEAKWENFNFWSRIIDISRGNKCVDGILIANYDCENSIRTDIRNNTVPYAGNVVPNILELNKTAHIKLEVKKTDNKFTINTYLDNNLKDTKTLEVELIRNIERTENYLGKSCFDNDGYFNGYIYNIKITEASGNVILWYDFT